MESLIPVRVKDITFNLVSVFASPALAVNCQVALGSSCHIFDLHDPMHIDVEFSNDEIVSWIIWPLYDNVLIRVRQYQVLKPHCSELKWTTPEEVLDVSVSVGVVALALWVECRNGRVMRNLLTKVAVVRLDYLESFSEDRIEGLTSATIDVRVLTHRENGNVA